MRVILFGATGMVGQGVLLECLAHPDVTAVLVVGRSSCGIQHAKLKELVRADMYDYAPIEAELKGYDACFFCLGISSVGMSEADYTRITYDLTLAAARALVKVSPGMTFIYVSGAHTDSTEKGSGMWARVKGKTENALFGLGFKAAYMFRPGAIQPVKGIRSRTRLYRAAYIAFAPLFPILKALAPDSITTSEKVGLAMIQVARKGAAKKLLENRDINELAALLAA